MTGHVAEDIDALIKRHRPWLQRVIAARTSDPALIEDVFAEVLLAVAKTADRPSAEDQVAPWLCRIAVRQAALANRTAMRRAQLSQQYAENATEDLDEDPIVWLLDQERNDMVRKVIGEMDPEMRRLLIAKYVEQKSYNALADELGVASHVAEYRVARAKKQLRSMLIGRGLDGGDVK